MKSLSLGSYCILDFQVYKIPLYIYLFWQDEALKWGNFKITMYV